MQTQIRLILLASFALLPALVGVGSVLVYMIVAFTLVEPLGCLGLVWADTAKQASHALVMVMMLRIKRPLM